MNLFAIIMLVTLTGCSSFGSNITESKSMDFKGAKDVDAAFAQDRKVEAPQPSNVTVSASGNSIVNYTPVEPPIQKDISVTGKSLKSKELMDQSMNQLFEQHSGMFYILLGVGLLIIVIAIRLAENSKVGRAVFAVGDQIVALQSKLIQTDKGDPKHSIYSEMMDDLREKKEKLLSRRS